MKYNPPVEQVRICEQAGCDNNVTGRKDKRFCSIKCRNAMHNPKRKGLRWELPKRATSDHIIGWEQDDTFQKIKDALMTDPLVDRVIDKMRERSRQGMESYGVSMEDNNSKSFVDWIDDAQEELMDAVIYLEKIKTKINGL
jgi:hypothetical protein